MPVASGPEISHENDTHSLQIILGGQALRRFYQVIIAATSLVILVTGASDLGFAFAQDGLILHLDLKLEGTAAVWYSSVLLLLAGLSALAIAANPPVQTTRRAQYRWVWTLAALFFLGLSLDETAQFHEMAGNIFTRRIGDVPGLTRGAGPAFAWIVALAPLILCFIVVMRTAADWLRQHRSSRRLALAGLACWIGVIVAEFVQAQLRRLSMERSVQGVIEEGLEVTGSTLFLIAFLEFLRFSQRASNRKA